MKVKVSEATDKVLDYLVALADGYDEGWLQRQLTNHNVSTRAIPTFSTNWSDGGPIIEREGLLLRALRSPGHNLDGQWLAMYDGTNTGTMVQWVKRKDWPRHYLAGPTPLIAAMRCFVASRLGDEVDVPQELMA